MCAWKEQKGEDEDTKQHAWQWQLGVTESRRRETGAARRGVWRDNVLASGVVRRRPEATALPLPVSYCAAAETRRQTVGRGA